MKALLNDTRGVLCQGQKEPAVGTEEEERRRRRGKKKNLTGGRLWTDGMEWGVCSGAENIFRYKTSNSRRSENTAPRASPVSLQEVGGWKEKKNDDGHIISHHGHHPSPPVVPIHAQGSYSMLLHTYIEKKGGGGYNMFFISAATARYRLGGSPQTRTTSRHGILHNNSFELLIIESTVCSNIHIASFSFICKFRFKLYSLHIVYLI